MGRPKKSDRLCRAIAERFEREFGLRLENVRLYPAKGFWRTNKRADVQPWNGWADVVFESESGEVGSYPIAIGSWDTMTDLLKSGFTVTKDNYSGFELDCIQSTTGETP